MKNLIEGMQGNFKKTYVPAHKELLEQFSHGQTPKVMFITCSDSRLDPNLLTQTEMGELFIVRNAGNIIPPYGATNGGEGATIEYAIEALGIEQIIICGHSQCGAMKGLLHLNKLQEGMPLVYNWLKHAEGTRRLVKDNFSNRTDEQMLDIAVAENVLTQMENLETYPVVHSRLFQGKLRVYGWVYYVETGKVVAYDRASHTYVPPESQMPDNNAQ